MEVKIEQVNRYTLTIGGVEHTDFRLESEWEGMAKYVGPRGVVIVSWPGRFSDKLFGEIFGRFDEPCVLVKASPCLIPTDQDEVPS